MKRWTKKNDISHYGCKDHVNMDRHFKLIRGYKVTSAAPHDNTALDAVFDLNNTSSDLWAASAYRSKERKANLKKRMIGSYIHHKRYRNKPLSKHKQDVNKRRSKVRARLEYVFGHQGNSMGGTLVRSTGIARAKAKIGL